MESASLYVLPSQQSSGAPVPNSSSYTRIYSWCVLNWTELDFAITVVVNGFLGVLFAFDLGCVGFWHCVGVNFYGVKFIDLCMVSFIDFELKKWLTGF